MVKYYSDIITKVRNSPKQLVIYISPNTTKIVLPLERGNDNKKFENAVFVIESC